MRTEYALLYNRAFLFAGINNIFIQRFCMLRIPRFDE